MNLCINNGIQKSWLFKRFPRPLTRIKNLHVLCFSFSHCFIFYTLYLNCSYHKYVHTNPCKHKYTHIHIIANTPTFSYFSCFPRLFSAAFFTYYLFFSSLRTFLETCFPLLFKSHEAYWLKPNATCIIIIFFFSRYFSLLLLLSL